jgi:hypothetical protein
MADDADEHETPTRRDYMKYGGAAVFGELFAGCSGQSEQGSTPKPNTETSPSDEPTTVAPSCDILRAVNGEGAKLPQAVGRARRRRGFPAWEYQLRFAVAGRGFRPVESREGHLRGFLARLSVSFERRVMIKIIFANSD